MAEALNKRSEFCDWRIMDRKKAIMMYLSGTIGQIFFVCSIVFLMRNFEIMVDSSTGFGMLAVGIGGISSALWGVIVAVKYNNTTVKRILIDFINIKQPPSSYLLIFVFLLLDFAYIIIGGKLQVSNWYMPFMIFLTAIIFGGIEEIGWRYTFQPILERKLNYTFSTIITFASWGLWHMMYFYIDGSLYQINVIEFLTGLFANCFILSTIYNKTKSLWLCVMTHALVNTASQISRGGNFYLSLVFKMAIIAAAIAFNQKKSITAHSK